MARVGPCGHDLAALVGNYSELSVDRADRDRSVHGQRAVPGDPQQFSSNGTYKVARDCTLTMDGSITIGAVNRQFGVIADQGRKIVTTRTNPGQSVVLTYERVD